MSAFAARSTRVAGMIQMCESVEASVDVIVLTGIFDIEASVRNRGGSRLTESCKGYGICAWCRYGGRLEHGWLGRSYYDPARRFSI